MMTELFMLLAVSMMLLAVFFIWHPFLWVVFLFFALVLALCGIWVVMYKDLKERYW